MNSVIVQPSSQVQNRLESYLFKGEGKKNIYFFTYFYFTYFIVTLTMDAARWLADSKLE